MRQELANQITILRDPGAITPEVETSRAKPAISILVPVFNEESIVRDNIGRLRRVLETVGYDYELLLCDDGSSDGTEREACAITSSTEMYLRFSQRLGKGGSFKNAAKVCNGKALILLDADAPLTSRELAQGLALLDSGYQLVIGARRSRVNLPVKRKVLSLGFNKCVNLLFKTGINDHQCGFKILDRSAAETLFPLIRSDSFLFDTELIVNARLLNLQVAEVELDWPETRRNGDSRVFSPRTVLTMLLELFFLRLSLVRGIRLVHSKQAYAGYFKIFQTGMVVPAEITRTVTTHTRIQNAFRRLYLRLAFKP